MEPSTIANQPPANASESPEDWVEQFGDLLFRTAVSRVGDREVAQDLVQEALLAAWRGRESFDGRSQRSTWLVAILKRKIADHFRATGRSREVSPSEEEGCELFDETRSLEVVCRQGLVQARNQGGTRGVLASPQALRGRATGHPGPGVRGPRTASSAAERCCRASGNHPAEPGGPLASSPAAASRLPRNPLDGGTGG